MTAGRIASLVLFVTLGALIGVALPGYRAGGAVRYLSNFHPAYDPPEGRTSWTSHPQAAIALPDAGCRPTRLRLRVRSPVEAGQGGLRYSVIGGTPVGHRALPEWTWQDVVVDAPPARGGYLRLVLDTGVVTVPSGARLGIGLHAVEVEAPDTACRLASVARHSVLGALLWVATSATLLGGVLRLVTRRRRATAAPMSADPSPDRAAAREHGMLPLAACGLAVAGLAFVFAVWTVMKPPTQSPDEVDHVVRAAGLVMAPWVAVDDCFCVPAALANPLAFPVPPASLAALYFRPDRQLSSEQIAGLRALRFPDAASCAQSHASSYPPLYYASVLAAAALAHPVFGLPPWESFAVMRFASALVGAMAWLPLLLLLRPLLPGDRSLLATLPLALAPMTGFITGAVNPDALHIPLALAAGVAWYRTLRTGDVAVAAHALLLGALLTKPPGVTLLLALLLVVPVGYRLGWWSREHATSAWRGLLFTGASAYALYYVWSPPAPPGPTPVGLTFGDGVALVMVRLPWVWPGFWGSLGYLDYGLPAVWNAAVAAPPLAGLLAMARRPSSVPTLTWFALLLLAVYLGLLLAVQFALIGSIGPVLQGRYLLPAGLAVPLVALAAGRRMAWGLVLVVATGTVWAWHLSVMRYYADGWVGWSQALPFVH